MVNDCGAALSKMITNRYSQRQDYCFACFYYNAELLDNNPY